MQIKAVIFDFDDTLLDARDARYNAIYKVASAISLKYCLSIDNVLKVLLYIEDLFEHKGLFNRDTWWTEAFRLLKIVPSDTIIKDLTEIYWESWIEKSRLFPDVIPSIHKLRNCGIKTGIITNTDGTPGLKYRRILRSGIPSDYIDLILVAGDDINDVKPSSKPYAKALSILGMKPYEVMYVGDKAYADVPGAKSIGIWTALLIRNAELSIIDELSNHEKPDVIITSLTQLISILRC